MTSAAQLDSLRCRQHRLPGKRTCRSRRGFSSVASILIFMIGIATLLLVVNWTYLNLASRKTQDLAETLAWSAVFQLLDDERLQDAPEFEQADDMDDTTDAIATPATAEVPGLLAKNNAAAGPTMQVRYDEMDPEASDLKLTFGHVNNANSQVTGGNFTTSPTAGDPYNTLVVEIFRDPGGANPVQLLIRGMGSPEAAKISGAAYATLDSRVLSFRPTAAVHAPVAPLAIESAAWFSSRPTMMSDTFLANGRYEFDFAIRTTDGSGTATAALISMDTTEAFDPANIPLQVEDGISDNDVNPVTGVFGPATATASAGHRCRCRHPRQLPGHCNSFRQRGPQPISAAGLSAIQLVHRSWRRLCHDQPYRLYRCSGAGQPN